MFLAVLDQVGIGIMSVTFLFVSLGNCFEKIGMREISNKARPPACCIGGKGGGGEGKTDG